MFAHTLDFVTLSLIASLWGAMLFFAVVMAPLIFTRLPAGQPGPFIRQVFPVYYLSLGVVSLLAGVMSWLSPGFEWLDGVLLVAVAAAFALARQWMMPRINEFSDAAQQGDQGAGRRFQQWHNASVVLNGVQMLAVLWVLWRV